MQLDRHHMELWSRALAGERELLTWELWEQRALAHQCFTPEGRLVVRHAVSVFRKFFGKKWLASSVNESMPPIEHTCWLDNQIPSVAGNFLDLYAKIALVAEDKSAQPLRNVMKRRIDGLEWRHCLLQLEVAGLAKRAGWGVAFEPEVGERNQADLCLTGAGEQKVFVDTVVLGLAESALQDRQWYDSVQDRMTWRLMQKFGNAVEVGGDVGRPGTEHELLDWSEQVYRAAERCAGGGERSVIPGPTGGSIEVGLAGRDKVRPLRGATVTTDEMNRIIQRIRKKRWQLAGASCLWIRIDHLGWLWYLTPWSRGNLKTKTDALLGALQPNLSAEGGVCGVVISGGPLVLAGEDIPEGTIQTSQSHGLRYRLPTGVARETFVLCGENADQRFAGTMAAWYQAEPGWLDWALSELGHPKLNALVRQLES